MAIVFSLVGFLGLLCLAVALALFRTEAECRRIRERGVPVTATVVATGVDEETAYVVLEYEYGGDRYTVREFRMSGPVGGRVPVLVDPMNPARVVPVHAPAGCIAPTLVACGLAAVVISAAVIYKQCSVEERPTPVGPPTRITIPTWR